MKGLERLDWDCLGNSVKILFSFMTNLLEKNKEMFIWLLYCPPGKVNGCKRTFLMKHSRMAPDWLKMRDVENMTDLETEGG